MTTLTNNQNDRLFTHLTAKEAAVIEGGAVFLSHIKALKLTKDEKDGHDEPYLLVNGRKIWEARGGMKVGDVRKIGKYAIDPRMWGGIPNIQLWENDGSGRLSDDLIGQLNVDRSSRPPLWKTATLTGSGAKYQLFYSI